MIKNINPFLATDAYKIGHAKMYPEGISLVYSNFTPRSGKHSNVDLGGIISFGQQMVIKEIVDMFDKGFFRRQDIDDLNGPEKLDHSSNEDGFYAEEIIMNETISEIKTEYDIYLGGDFDISSIKKLWKLGYLPVTFRSIPEGEFVPYGVPVLTVVNTDAEFFWLTNFLETLISTLLWKPMTSATTSFAYKKLLNKWALMTDKNNLSSVNFQGHDFSMRGMDSVFATISSSLGHLTSFDGSDSLPAIYGARVFYNEKGFVAGSVNATEHSVMSAGTRGDEIGTFRYLMKQFPTGILSIVSDTWDLWKVLTEYLPTLKEEISSRDGKIVIRPDSGDPVDIICGTTTYPNKEIFNRALEITSQKEIEDVRTSENKGVIELLWDIFGGTINEQGYKVLDPHIGAIYGDSITIERAEEICKRLEAKGFASTNIVLGIGSYTYQYNTRDTHGFAMKATYVELLEADTSLGENDSELALKTVGREIFKDPVTDDGTKKSLKGLIMVQRNEGNGDYEAIDQVKWNDVSNDEMKVIYSNGKFRNNVSFTEIKQKVKNLMI